MIVKCFHCNRFGSDEVLGEILVKLFSSFKDDAVGVKIDRLLIITNYIVKMLIFNYCVVELLVHAILFGVNLPLGVSNPINLGIDASNFVSNLNFSKLQNS